MGVFEEQRTVSFTSMKNGTKADYDLLGRMEAAFVAGTAERVIDQVERLAHSISGYRVSRLEHSLQTATRAERDGADIDWIVTALLHDIGDDLAPLNHDSIAAAVIKPYVREECTWVCQHHGIFQLIYYAHHYGDDPNARDRFRNHRYYQAAVDFCERWDQASFDPNYDTLPLGHFRPLVEDVFSRRPWCDEYLRPGEQLPLFNA